MGSPIVWKHPKNSSLSGFGGWSASLSADLSVTRTVCFGSGVSGFFPGHESVGYWRKNLSSRIKITRSSRCLSTSLKLIGNAINR